MATFQCQNLRAMPVWSAVLALVLVAFAPSTARAQLSTTFYDKSCPNLVSIVKSGLQKALYSDGRIGASLLRMSFHDCFVQGCDGSVLLDDTATFKGEKTARPNVNSLRGFDIIDDIKSSVEGICPKTVSCADILAVVAEAGVEAAGGPSWPVALGRRDSLTANFSGANNEIPSPFTGVSNLTAKFIAKGLSELDMVTLSGAHTFGKGHCALFSSRLYNFSGTLAPDPTLNSGYLAKLKSECPQDVSASVVVNLDPGTPTTFDNSYYADLLSNNGLFTSDQSLESEGGFTAGAVSAYGKNQNQFFSQFVTSMISLAAINPLTGCEGEIRTNCRCVNT